MEMLKLFYIEIKMYIIKFRVYIFNTDCSKTYLKLDNSSACSFSWTPKISFVEFVESFIPLEATPARHDKVIRARFQLPRGI